MKLGRSNPILIETIKILRSAAKSQNRGIWDALADELEKRGGGRIVNLSKLDRYLEEGDIAAVPGKVLGGGSITKKVTVAAVAFSAKARSKIEAVGGRCISLRRLVEENPSGSYVKIIG
ncbi:MAG: 50S ribosomal protein L18e [Nitrososphaerota archaeon]|nr:50S ribosomal protein L18e [Candidatus Bathyarchaeota archaeon]MCX8162747.1 50S ribosomal protein L18e [Candidatus Bathyarchaeota archaeon]MDW8061624.1 50S ribosomal protein L18e [Nitrososphaerota archaeon]